MKQIEKILAGDVRSAAMLIRDIDDGRPGATEALKALYRRTGRARVIGITGSPGSGKSTICDGLIGHYRKLGLKVGVLAIDPTSPYSGGAILGDRIRMQDHSVDPGVFIRSLATRGCLGGLSSSTRDSIKVMDAMGMDVVLVETVGVGQDEVDIARTAHTTIVVLIPGMGDDIQAIKAGLLEVADCFVINKCDREGADKVFREIMVMLEMRGVSPDTWTPPIVRMIAMRGEGFGELAEAVNGHREWCSHYERAPAIMEARAEQEISEILRSRIRNLVERKLSAENGGLRGIAERMLEGGRDPYTVTEELLRKALT